MICEHGQLKRQCDKCELIAELRREETRAARVTNQLSVVRTLVGKYRKREMNAKAVIVAIEDMFRANPDMHEREA